MKRLLTLALALILMITVTVSASAVTFVESITNKGAPELVVIDQIEGKDVVGFVTTPDGEIITTEHEDCFDIYSMEDVIKDRTPDDVEDEMNKAYDELSKPDVSLNDICPGLDEVVKEKWSPDKSADDLVVRDFFYIDETCGEFQDAFKNGNTIDLTFRVNIPAGTFFTAMVYVDGKWIPVDNCVNNGDGTVTVTFSQICPVAFLVPGTTMSADTVSPATSDISGAITWGVVMVASLAAIAVLVIYRRRVNG